ncbi:predicted protein [Naegleria gruberi]|uniref:Predicted protein n=1 Tax=Naegleria gruberi TaxID=5762 RepID=D2W3F1_NAEGR|nr:uncharacterized protein NAEGRDRAFT_75922 [Naegleria gruberi]EFC36409.1 predicted protein [Naegleria gruberi]|eukprot:XP_002669153.1 predicted protein [Naegleria gruberi strain NEG-M]
MNVDHCTDHTIRRTSSSSRMEDVDEDADRVGRRLCFYKDEVKNDVIREQFGNRHHDDAEYMANLIGKVIMMFGVSSLCSSTILLPSLRKSQSSSSSSKLVLLLLSSILILLLTTINSSSSYFMVECSSSPSPSSRFVSYLQQSSMYSKLSSSYNNLFNNKNSILSQPHDDQQEFPTGLDCSYFSNSNNNNNKNLESCNSLPLEHSPFSTFTIRLTGGTDAVYGTSYPPILYPLSSTSTSKLFNNHNNINNINQNNYHDVNSMESTSEETIITTSSIDRDDQQHVLIPNNQTSYCYQVQKWLDQQGTLATTNQQQEQEIGVALSQIPTMCSQFFCNPKDSSNRLIIQEIFSNLSRSLSENSFFPSVVTTQFSIKLTLENSSEISGSNYYEEEEEPTTGWITMTISQLTRLYNYCHYCKVGNPSFELFKKEREEGQCTLPFSMNALKSASASSKDSSTNMTTAAMKSDLLGLETDQDICGQKGYSLPLLNTMTYSSLNDPRLLYYFPYRVCYCYSSSSFSSKCDEWSDLYYTNDFQNGIRGMFIGLYLIQLLLIIAIVLIPLLYKHVRLGTRSSLARITTDTSSTQDLQAKLTFDENSYSFKLISETTPKKSFKQRSRSNSPSVLPILDQSSDSEDTITSSYYKYETEKTEKNTPEIDTPLLNLGTPKRRKTNWKRVFKSLAKSVFDFRIIATIISITNLIAGFLSLIPSLPYDARLVLISITCVLSLMGLIPIVFQWLVVLRKIDSQDPTSHSGRHIKALSIVVFTSTIMLFIGYMLTVIFVSGYSSVLLARYIMLVVLFLYFIICFPLLVGYGIKVYFRVLKNNNEIRFFQFKFTKYLLFESLTYLYFTCYTVYFIISYPYFLTTFNNIGDRFMSVYPWSITHIFIILSHCNRFYFLSDTSFIKIFYTKHLCCCLMKKKKKRKLHHSSKPSPQQSKVQYYEQSGTTSVTTNTQRKISSASTSSSVHDDSSISF